MSEPELRAIERMSDRIEEIHRQLSIEAVKRDDRIRTNRLLTLVSSLVGVVGIAVAIVAIVLLIAYKHQIASSRVTGCKQFNVQEVRGAHREQTEIRALGSPKQIKKAAAALKRFDRVTTTERFRDCSPHGIADYIAGHPHYRDRPRPHIDLP